MPKLSASQRAKLPKSAFAYIDSAGVRRLPIYDRAHVRTALSRFNQVKFETDADRDAARTRLLRAARKFGVVPVGFIEAQLRTERGRGRAETRADRMATLPTGTVTFLMTDIEGSTGLLAALGEAYPPLLARVRRLLRTEVRRAGGQEVEVHADEFLAVFTHAPDAVEAAVAIQRRMAAKGWPKGHPVRVRIGLHRGHPNLTETGYIGLSLHAVRRLCSAAHGGQIVASRAVAEAVADAEVGGFAHLGIHRLRGFPRPDVLYQVQTDGLPAKFPALRTEV